MVVHKFIEPTFIFVNKVEIQSVSYGFEECCDWATRNIVQGSNSNTVNLTSKDINYKKDRESVPS